MDPRPSPPQRILIVRVSALGDLVFCTALLEGLRRAYPEAHIAWLAQPGLGALLDKDPRLNQLIRLPAGAFGSLAGFIATWRQLRAQSPFDWVIDAQGLFKSRLLARLVPARRRIGFASKEPGRFLLHALHDKSGEPRQIAREYRYLSQRLTGGADPGPPRLLPDAAARERVDQLLQGAQLRPGFVAFCAFTTRPQKHWMESYWGELAHRLRAQGLGPCVLLGSADDQPAAQRILRGMPADSVNLVGATRIGELPALLEQARLVVGVDTGLTHIGSAVRRPTIGLWGSTCPYTQGAASPLKILYLDLPCAPCKRRPTCGGVYSCMRDLGPEQVAGAARQLLEDAA